MLIVVQGEINGNNQFFRLFGFMVNHKKREFRNLYDEVFLPNVLKKNCMKIGFGKALRLLFDVVVDMNILNIANEEGFLIQRRLQVNLNFM